MASADFVVRNDEAVGSIPTSSTKDPFKKRPFAFRKLGVLLTARPFDSIQQRVLLNQPVFRENYLHRDPVERDPGARKCEESG
jgi:hypothetical protein